MGEAPLVILPFPPSFEPVRNVRSTLIISSFNTIREAGYEKAYVAALPGKHLPTIRDAVAGMWLPVEIAVAHYAACDALGLSHDTQVAMGRTVQAKVNGTLLGTAVRMAKGVGVTPLTVLPQFQRFWNRAFDGGGISATKIGPKEVNMEVQKAVFVDIPYYRAALSGLAMGVLELFCQKAYMLERNVRRAPGGAIYRIQWA